MSTTRPDPHTGFDPRDFAPPGVRAPAEDPFTLEPPPSPGGRGRRFWVLVGGVAMAVVAVVAGAFLLLGGEDTEPDGVVATAPAQDGAQATPSPLSADSDDPATAQDGGGMLPDAPARLQRAAGFAVQFANSYLNYDAEAPDIRERELSAFLAAGLDPQLGWDGQGRQVAALTVALEVAEQPDGRVEVIVAAQVTGPRAPRWVHLAVPLAADADGRWAVIAPPSFVPRPAAGRPIVPAAPPVDLALSEELAGPVAEVMAVYGAEPVVSVPGLTAPDATIRGLSGAFALVEVTSVSVHAGDGPVRTAEVVVTWDNEVTGGQVSQGYTVELVQSDGTAPDGSPGNGTQAGGYLVTAITP